MKGMKKYLTHISHKRIYDCRAKAGHLNGSRNRLYISSNYANFGIFRHIQFRQDCFRLPAELFPDFGSYFLPFFSSFSILAVGLGIFGAASGRIELRQVDQSERCMSDIAARGCSSEFRRSNCRRQKCRRKKKRRRKSI